MLIFKHKPRTGGTRWRKSSMFVISWNALFQKFLLKKKKKAGRIHGGLISVRHKKSVKNSAAFLCTQNTFTKKSVGLVMSLFLLQKAKRYVALVKFCDGSYFVINATNSAFVGSYFLYNSLEREHELRQCLRCVSLSVLNHFMIVSFLVGPAKKQAQYCMSSGCYGQLLLSFAEKKISLVVLPSGQRKYLPSDTMCLIGRASNHEKKFEVLGKAGLSFLSGSRPTVRGNAMNPIDHPHGGRTKSKQPEVSPWGWVAKKGK